MIDIKHGITIVSGLYGRPCACFMQDVEYAHPSGVILHSATGEIGPSKDWMDFLKSDKGRRASEWLRMLPVEERKHEGLGLSCSTPENGLHPQVQICFAECVAHIVACGKAAGMWAVVDTFSPFVVKGLLAYAERLGVPIAGLRIEDDFMTIDGYHAEETSGNAIYEDLIRPLKQLRTASRFDRQAGKK